VFGMGTGVAPPLVSPGKIARPQGTPPYPDNYTVSRNFVPGRKMIAAWSSARPISTGKLKTLLSLHTQPINLVVYQGPYSSKLEET
jgi:hypothetical protein